MIHAAVMAITDLPLILILSVYTDFVPLEFGKIQIFFNEIWQNTDFLPRNLAKYRFFTGIQMGFLYIFFSHTDFFPKIQIFLVIYTDFVQYQSGRSAIIVYLVIM